MYYYQTSLIVGSCCSLVFELDKAVALGFPIGTAIQPCQISLCVLPIIHSEVPHPATPQDLSQP